MMEVLRMIPGVSRLPIASVEKYLLRQGWTKGTTTNPNAMVYEGPLWDVHGNPLTVVLPARKSLGDADRRIMDVVRTLAAIESKSPESVVEAMFHGGTRRRLVTGKVHSKVLPRSQVAKQVASEV